ncbi:hypothetical protein NLI96_g3765 [Meripilus lineatus]|uniref:Uncharacterized protein n=1 Tax=Meripilus lineatus TaxID=2056292 RepID=A0AAD5YKJ6_9APHY|nr:hypothetical protein NLI96_g3765 [Physisporinus lineatus]
MLPLLRKVATRAIRSTLADSTDFLTAEEDPILSVNVDELRELLPPLPEIPWARVVDLCSKTVTPVYTAVQKTFCDDMDHVAQLLVDLDPPSFDEPEPRRDVRANFYRVTVRPTRDDSLSPHIIRKPCASKAEIFILGMDLDLTFS